jgi:uncharacterized membrane protein
VHPFDIKSALLARHAQHVVLIHFPIALFLTGVVFDVVAQRTRNQAVAAVAYYNLLAAAISTFPVLLTGVLAWQWVLGGHKLKGVLLLHFALACVTSVLIWMVGWLHFRSGRDPARGLPLYRFPVEILAVFAVALTAHLGGFLSGINGPS